MRTPHRRLCQVSNIGTYERGALIFGKGSLLDHLKSAARPGLLPTTQFHAMTQTAARITSLMRTVGLFFRISANVALAFLIGDIRPACVLLAHAAKNSSASV